MDLPTTLIVLAASAVLAVLGLWADRRRKGYPHGLLALLPWHGVLFLAFAGLLFMGVHLLTLIG